MGWLDAIHNRLLAPGCLINSLPKAGTNLLAKAMRLFPGLRYSEIHLGQSTLPRPQPGHDQANPTVFLGVDWPQPVPVNAVRGYLRRLKRGHFATAHLPYSQAWGDLLAETGVKSLLIYRDPRDVVVSHAFYVARSPDHFLYETYRRLSPAEQLMKSIVGIQATTPGGPLLLNIAERCQLVLPWMTHPRNCTTYFHRLVGPQGGGTQQEQIAELTKIAEHLRIWCSRNELERIGRNLFGGTTTFREGVIGQWRNHFTPEHKCKFKELANEVLIDLGCERNEDW